MSWDLFVQDWGDFNTLSEIPGNFQPKPIGSRAEIISKILEVEPLVNFFDPSWGILDTAHFSIEFNMGSDDEVQSFVMHIRGREFAAPHIQHILEKLNLRASDGSSETFFS